MADQNMLEWRLNEIEDKLTVLTQMLSKLYESQLNRRDFYHLYLQAEQRKLKERATKLTNRTRIIEALLKWGGWFALAVAIAQRVLQEAL